MKILLVRNYNIGDLIYTTPAAIEALRKKYYNKHYYSLNYIKIFVKVKQ